MSKSKNQKDIDAKLAKSINALANVNRKLCDVIESEKRSIAYKITDGIPVIIQSEAEIEIVKNILTKFTRKIEEVNCKVIIRTIKKDDATIDDVIALCGNILKEYNNQTNPLVLRSSKTSEYIMITLDFKPIAEIFEF